MGSATTLSLSSLPSEILLNIAINPSDICLLSQTNKKLSGILSSDKIWQPIFSNYRKYAYRKKDHVTYKAATLGINHARFSYVFYFSKFT